MMMMMKLRDPLFLRRARGRLGGWVGGGGYGSTFRITSKQTTTTKTKRKKNREIEFLSGSSAVLGCDRSSLGPQPCPSSGSVTRTHARTHKKRLRLSHRGTAASLCVLAHSEKAPPSPPLQPPSPCCSLPILQMCCKKSSTCDNNSITR